MNCPDLRFAGGAPGCIVNECKDKKGIWWLSVLKKSQTLVETWFGKKSEEKKCLKT